MSPRKIARKLVLVAFGLLLGAALLINVVHVNASDGDLDTSFNPGTGVDSAVFTSVVQPDGKIIIGGFFTTYNGTSRNHVARINTDGSLDTSFDPGVGANCSVLASAVEADGRIVIGGCFTPYDGIKGLDYLAQLNSDGSVNTLFNSGTGPNTEVNTIAILPGSKLFIGGDFTAYNGTSRKGVALLKLSVNAPTDISLSNSTVADNTPSGTTVGTLSTTAPPVGDTFTYTLVAGAGDVDNSSFTITGSALKAAVGLDFESRPKYYIRVRSTNTGGDFIEKQFTINVTDGPDTPGAISFSSANYSVGEGDGSANVTLKRTGGSDNRVIAKVSLTDVTTSPADYSFTPGALDASFDPGTGTGGPTVYTAALRPDNKVIIGGSFITYNGTARNHIARLNADGSLDTSFNPGTGSNDTVYALALQPDGKILIGGDFISYNGTTRNRIARLNSDGSLDTSFAPTVGASNGIRAIALQPDGKILIGGFFIGYNKTSRNHIARLNSDGSLDTSFDPGTGTTNADVQDIIIQPDGKPLLFGGFTSYNGTTRKGIARVQGDLYVVWAPGDSADKTIQLPIVDDSIQETDETLTLTLTPLAGGATSGTPSSATLTIVDNDQSPTSISSVSGAGTFSGTATLSATLKSVGNPLSGKTVSFTVNGASACDVTGKPSCPVTDSNGVATLSNVSLAGINAGTYPAGVTASFARDINYAGSSGAGTLTVNKASQTITFNALSAKTFGDADFQLSATASSGLTVGFAATGNCTVSGSTVHITGAGSCSITASQSGNSNFNAAADVSQSFTINKAQATITLSNLTQVYDGNPKSATATTNPAGLSGVTISYSQNGQSVAQPTNAGSYDVVASLSNSNYQATNATGTLVINKATATVTLSNLTQTYDGNPKSATAATNPAGKTVVFSYSQNNQAVASPTNAGSYNVSATINDANYQGSASGTLTINKATPLITWNNPADITYGTALSATQLNASATVAGTFSYSPAAGTVLSAGSNQPLTANFTPTDGANYNSASKSVSINVVKANQTITFNALQNKTFGDADFSLSATAISGLSVSFAATGQCSITGTTIHITSAGSCKVTASQPGNANYNAAPSVDQSFTINKATATITLSNLTQTYDGTAKAAIATTNPQGLSVVIAYSQNNVAVTSPTSAGSYNVTATVNDSNYQGSQTGTLVINKATPVITWANPANITFGTPLTSAQLNATANVPGTFSYNPPSGTVLNIGINQLSVTFTPTDAANYTTAQKSVQITVDAPANTITLSKSGYSVGEGDGNLAVIVNRTGDASFAATVDYTTSDTAGLQPCDQFNGVASSRCDYATTVGTLRFAAGETTKTIFIPLVDDSYAEGPETFSITLSNSAGESLGAVSTATITIVDNDNTTGTNPLLNVNFFVRQQYIDFLGREPDPVGFNGWLDVLSNCGAKYPTPCDRIEVSGDFFRSPEFQDRGYFIYRFYSTIGRHPFYAEFMPDLAKVSGFLTDQQLEANKAAYVIEFMARSEFQTKYGSFTDPAQYVDALLQTVGLPNHPTRATWINSLANGTMTRAQVLRALVESAEVYQKYYNEAFVVMQYFGYLRRDPDILYLQWIDTLNKTGDYRTMINGFMNSSEYAKRFGP